jgi:MFS family permease
LPRKSNWPSGRIRTGSLVVRSLNWSAAPEGATPTQKKNFQRAQIDGIGVGLEITAAMFLTVYLTRLGATNLQIGLLTAMPAIAGLFFTIAAGRFLQGRRNLVPWHSGTRLVYVSSYALIGIATWIVPQDYAAPTLLAIRMLATLALPFLGVAFTIVMNAVAGPEGRYALMGRRWSIMALASAAAMMAAGYFLDLVRFPLNYQLVLIGLSAGGLISFFSSNRIELPDAEPPQHTVALPLVQRFKGHIDLIRQERPFTAFTAKRFVFMMGWMLALPLFPLYYVRVLHASDAWIGAINSTQTAAMLLGFIFWTRQHRARGSRFVLLWTTFGLALYPALTASTHHVLLIALLAGLAGILLAGQNLVFFDELMKVVPARHSAIFVSLALTLQFLASATAPLLGSYLADHVGLRGALLTSALICLTGVGLFARRKEGTAP